MKKGAYHADEGGKLRGGLRISRHRERLDVKSRWEEEEVYGFSGEGRLINVVGFELVVMEC
jgi:hypothetical protein